MSVIDLAVRRDVGGRLADRVDIDLVNNMVKALLAVVPDHPVAHRVGPSDRQNSPIGAFALNKVSACTRRIFEDRLAGYTRYCASLCAPINIGAEVRCVNGAFRAADILIPALLAEIDALLLVAALEFTFEGIGDR